MNSNKTYAQDAQNYAIKAVWAAMVCQIAKKEWELLKQAFGTTPDIMHDVFVAIMSLCCISVSSGEIIFSYEIYKDIALRNFGNEALVYIIAAIVVLWGLAASHLIAPNISKRVRSFNEQRLILQDELDSVVEDKIARQTQAHFRVGLLAAILVIAFVLGLSLMRIAELSKIYPDYQYSWVDICLPSILICLEILTGIYMAYVVLRLSVYFRIRSHKSRFEEYKLICHAETQRAVACYRKAIEMNEDVHLSRELKDALYRFSNRTLANDDFTAPIAGDIVHGFQENGKMPKEERKQSIP